MGRRGTSLQHLMARSQSVRTRRTPSAAERRRATQELRVLAHPLRLRLIEMFAGEPRTTMQVAALLGEPPTRLYHHVNALHRAGLLRLARTRKVRGTTEKYFTVARQRITAGVAAGNTPGSRATLRGMAAMVFDQARSELFAAMDEPATLTRETAPLLLRTVLAIPPSHQARVRRRIMAAIAGVQRDLKGCDDPAAPQWTLTLGFAPVPVAKRRK